MVQVGKLVHNHRTGLIGKVSALLPNGRVRIKWEDKSYSTVKQEEVHRVSDQKE